MIKKSNRTAKAYIIIFVLALATGLLPTGVSRESLQEFCSTAGLECGARVIGESETIEKTSRGYPLTYYEAYAYTSAKSEFSLLRASLNVIFWFSAYHLIYVVASSTKKKRT